MLGSGVLNVVLGIIFIFLLYSLLATALREAIASILNHRAAMLYEGIKSMLTNTPQSKRSFVKKICYSLSESVAGLLHRIKSLFCDKQPKTIYDKFYDHPIIKNYGQSSYFNKPSYLSQSNFSEILLSVIKDLDEANWGKPATTAMLKAVLDDNKLSAIIDDDLKRILNHHLSEAAGDINVFRSRVEQWYNDTMDRVSGWYQRSTHFWLFGIGLFLAITLNIDTIQIAGYLSKNPDKAKQLADAAAAYSNNHPSAGAAGKDSANRQYGDSLSKQALDSLKNQLSTVNTLLGLGWGNYGADDSSYLAQMTDTIKNDSIKPAKPTCCHLLGRLLYCIADIDIMHGVDAKNKDLLIKRYSIVMRKHSTTAQMWYIWYRISWSNFFSFFITAIAIGLGAPFWFDMLNKIAKLRTAGNATGTNDNTPAGTQSTTQIDG